MKQLEAHERRVSEVLDSSYEFHIPEYQRPYAWDEQNALQLLDDLKEALERDTDEPYFLGSIVLVKDQGVPKCDVIDGQQRLTTLSLLLAVIRDLDAAASLQNSLQARLLEPGDELQGTRPSARLTLRKRDREFFETSVIPLGGTVRLVGLPDGKLETEAQENLRNNAIALRNELMEWEPSKVVDLAKLIGLRTFLVVVSTPDLTSAHRIFSVMNSRGLDLSPADLIKAQIIGRIDEQLREKYAERWEAVENEVGRGEFAELFLYLRTIYRKERARVSLLNEYEDHILPNFVGREDVFVDDFVAPYGDLYEQILNPRAGTDAATKAIETTLKQLSRLDDDDWRPVALWAMRHLGDDPLALATMLRRLERLAASMHIRREYTTPRVQRYVTVLKELDEGKGIEAPALDLTAAERSQTLEALDGDVYLQRRARRYILTRLDEQLANTAGVTYEHSIITVEHVLPQNPADGSDWLTLFDDESRGRWTHRIANLVLLNRRKNSEARNYEFSVKKERYFTSKKGTTTFALTGQVLKTGAWTPQVLEARQSALIEALAAMWDLT